MSILILVQGRSIAQNSQFSDLIMGGEDQTDGSRGAQEN